MGFITFYFNKEDEGSNRQAIEKASGEETAKRRANRKEEKEKKAAGEMPHGLAEPDDEWDGPFMLPQHINGDPIPNYPQILCKFKIDDFGIDLNSAASTKSATLSSSSVVDMLSESNEYLQLVLNRIQIDFAVTKYGVNFRAGLGDLKLIDRIHSLLDARQQPQQQLQRRQPTEILSSSTNDDNQIIRFYFRQVEEDAPNFVTLYGNILKNVLFECSTIHVACHRTAIVFLLEYLTGKTIV